MMTTVRVKKKEKRYWVEVTGHAGFSDQNDIVCSAVSVLGFTLINGLKNELGTRCELSYQDGEIRIFAFPDQEQEHDMQMILKTVLLGYELLAEQYPKYVKIQGKEEIK